MRRGQATTIAAIGALALVTILAVSWLAATGRLPAARAVDRPVHGDAVVLRGTPHYWVGGEDGMLHWVSDTRALAGRYVRWARLREVSAAELERLPRGEPWLATPVAFVRAPGGGYSLVRWDVGMRWPVLLRLPSADRLALFGLTTDLIERHALDLATWERLNDLRAEHVQIDFTLADGGYPYGWRAGTLRGTGAQRFPAGTYPVIVTLAPPRLDPYLGVVAGTVSYPSFPCSGELGLLSISAERLELSERVTNGLDECTEQGRVTLEWRSDLRSFYIWSQPTTDMTVTGFLLRDPEPGATPSPGAGTPDAR